MDKRKKAIVMLAIFMLSILLVGCNKEGEKINPGVTVDGSGKNDDAFSLTPESNKIVAWLWNSDPEDPLVNDFIQANPEFEVDNSTSASDGFDKDLPRLAAAIASNEAPDLFIGYMPPIEAFYTDLFISLQGFFENDPNYNLDTVEPNALIEATFNDEIYFLPFAFTVPIIVYNKDMFKNAGLDPDKPPRTWSELIEYNDKLVKYDTGGKLLQIGFEVDYNFFHLADWRIASFNEHFTDKTGLIFEFNKDSRVRTMEFMRDLSKPFGGFENQAGKSFFGGSAAMAYWSGDGVCLISAWTDLNFGIAPLPKPDDVEEDYIASSIDNLFGIPRDYSNPRGAWKFATYLMTEGKYADAVRWYEENLNHCILTYITHVPTRERLYDYFKDILTEESWELIQARDEIMQKANYPAYETVVQSEFNNYMAPLFLKMLKNELPPRDLCMEADSYGNILIEDFIKRKKEEGWQFNEDGTVIPPSAKSN